MGKVKLENHEVDFGLHSKHSGTAKSALALPCSCKTYNHEPIGTRRDALLGVLLKPEMGISRKHDLHLARGYKKKKAFSQMTDC
eukprot:32231-Pelagomonas_calceolata.AAC.1